jgi:transposase
LLSSFSGHFLLVESRFIYAGLARFSTAVNAAAGGRLQEERSIMKKKQSSIANRRRSSRRCGNLAESCGHSVQSWTVGALPIVDYLLKRMRLEEFLQYYLPKEDGRTKLPTARALVVLVKNFLLSREPLYAVGDWVARHDSKLLGLTPEEALAWNDDRGGRALATLFRVERPSLILGLMRFVVQAFRLALDELHNDSTTVTLCGIYADAAEEKMRRGKKTVAITWGHNKDHRPDLKQLLYILTVTSDGGVPVSFRVVSGNVTDDTTHCDSWDLLRQLTGCPDFLYVADCKLATVENMNYIAGKNGRFVSVLPRTRCEDEDFRERVRNKQVEWQALWNKTDDQGEVLDSYSIASRPESLSEGYRLWWYSSTRKAELDLATRSRQLRRAEQQLRELQQRLRSPRTRLRDAGKVHELATKILDACDAKQWIHFHIEKHVQETYRQSRRGRPSKDMQYVKTESVRLHLDYTIDEPQLARERLTDGIFPLVTNDSNLSALELLHAYKRQPQIERRFEQLKTDYHVAPVFLKDVARIEAFLCVYYFALLTEALLERELRKRMQRLGLAQLPLYPEGRDCRRPTARRLFDVFEPIQRHVLTRPGAEPIVMTTELSPLQRTLLRVLGLPAAIYQ